MFPLLSSLSQRRTPCRSTHSLYALCRTPQNSLALVFEDSIVPERFVAVAAGGRTRGGLRSRAVGARAEVLCEVLERKGDCVCALTAGSVIRMPSVVGSSERF